MKKVRSIFKYIVVSIFLLLLVVSVYINYKFKGTSTEQLIFTILNSEGSSMEALTEGITFVSVGFVLMIGMFIVANIFISKINPGIYLLFKLKNKKLRFQVVKHIKWAFTTSVIVLSFSLSIILLNLGEYVEAQLTNSDLFDNYYVSAKETKLKFPNKKQNLIYIYVESLETTSVSSQNGGLQKESQIPNLEKLALDNINFSNTHNLGGALSVNGTGWTAAALIAHTAGIPLKVSVDGNNYSGYQEYLPGAYSLGEVLQDAGYNNYFMMGSEATFGGRKEYLSQHGDYTIFDYEYAKENKLIKEDYYEWWGYEDSKLYSFAKDKLLSISKEEEPFNFTILTADTHFVDGYLDPSCKTKFDSQYANSFYCADQMLLKFINWIKEQEFYENTTIVIVGDHLTMQSGFYEENDEFTRSIYNAIINSKVKPSKEKNRYFSTLDFFPTTLAALGVEIEGDRLGLGTNLFSNKETLLEELGYETFNSELYKKSFFYDNTILGSSYYEMQS